MEELSQRVDPKEQHFIIAYDFGNQDDSHGFLGGNLYHIVRKRGKATHWFEALDERTEIESHRAYYDKLVSNPKNRFMLKSNHPFHSFEGFLDIAVANAENMELPRERALHWRTE